MGLTLCYTIGIMGSSYSISEARWGWSYTKLYMRKDLTVTLTFWYTMYIMRKQIKEWGLIDGDFLQGMALMLLPVLLTLV